MSDDLDYLNDDLDAARVIIHAVAFAIVVLLVGVALWTLT